MKNKKKEWKKEPNHSLLLASREGFPSMIIKHPDDGCDTKDTDLFDRWSEM
jgi:hypothetical protein